MGEPRARQSSETDEATALRTDGLRFRALATSPFDLISEVDAAGNVLFVASAPDGTPRDTPRFDLQSVHPEDREEVATAFARAFEDGRSARLTFRAQRGNGEPCWIEVTINPIGPDPDAPKAPPRALLIARDVSVYKDAETRLRGSRERFRQIAENAYDMIAEFDMDGNVHYVNDQVFRALGRRGDDLWRTQPGELVHPDDRERVQQAFARALAADEPVTVLYRAVHADGSWRWLEARYRAGTTAEGERRITLIARDRTHEVDAERRLVDSDHRYRALVEKAPLGIVVLQRGTVVFANPVAAEICGAESPDAVVGVAMTDLLDTRDPEVARRIRAVQDAEVGAHTLIELQIRGLDGQLRHGIATGNTIEFEGAPAYQGFVRDITGLHEAERERQRLELQLQEARKLESLGMLAGGIAHDFNNLLAVILANVRFALRHGAGDADLTEALEETVDAGERAARLTRQLLAYAGRRAPDVRAASVTDLVKATSGLLGSAMPGHVELVVDLDEDVPAVRADIVQIEQVLMNLVINAAEATGEEPAEIRVSTGSTTLRSGSRRRFVEGIAPAPGRYAYFEVADEGSGMDTATRSRIFEPFFTTKTEGHGLGLAAVIGLVKGHGGAVELETEPGKGTRFRVYLPVAPLASEAGESA